MSLTACFHDSERMAPIRRKRAGGSRGKRKKMKVATKASSCSQVLQKVPKKSFPQIFCVHSALGANFARESVKLYRKTLIIGSECRRVFEHGQGCHAGPSTYSSVLEFTRVAEFV